MENNQAFGWLMKSAVSALLPTANTNINAIEGCNDISVLVDGVARDFETLLSAVLSSACTGGGVNTANVPNDKNASSSSDVPSTETNNNNNNNTKDNLTARLDRIKTLLYEERSASSAAVTNNNGSISLNWTPGVATEVFKCFTTNNNNDATTTTTNGGSNPIQQDLLPKLLQNLPSLPFEARKSISAIFNYLLVCGLDGVDAIQFASVSTAFAAYVLQRATLIIGTFVHCHDCKSQGKSEGGSGGGGGDNGVDITLLCGSMLRSSLRHASIYRWVLEDANCEQLVYPFLDEYVHDPNFDVSSDALETVRVMFTGLAAPAGGGGGSGGGGGGGVDGYNDDTDTAYEEYKQQMEGIAAEFLERTYDPIIMDRMNHKCISSNANYMTRRMSLQLLSTILLNRSNFNVMMKYISSSQNLVTILCLLRDPSPHITLDAFQVFKIFVANPGKPPEVVKILFDNKVKLIKYLSGLHKEREGSDEQYRDEKGLVIATLEGLELES